MVGNARERFVDRRCGVVCISERGTYRSSEITKSGVVSVVVGTVVRAIVRTSRRMF